ncbi:MAG: ABC transporter permease [Acidobacteria bacterium]|nr:ABC transporter permease [Acidobacteriota bacterium]
MWPRLREVIRKELLQAMREPRMRVMLFVPPLVQLIVFGYAVNLDVEHARMAWMDQDRTPESRELAAAFTGSGHFSISATPEREAEAQALLDKDRVQAIVSILPGFARSVKRGETAAVQILVDGTNSNTASILSGYASKIVRTYAAEVLAEQQRIRLIARTAQAGEAVAVALPSVAAEGRVWFNPELRSRNYFVPGVLANVITVVTLIMTAMALVREKEIGTMEQLMVTPLRPVELILGKTIPFAVVGLIDVVLVTAAALLIFHIPFRGSGLMLLGCSVLFLLTTLGAGLFISTISQTQQQAMMASFFFFLPAFMLSGFAFPIRNMPLAVQLLTYVNPVRYFVEILRGVFLKGSGVQVLWPQMLGLSLLGTVVLGLSILRFHKRLD